MLDIAQRNGATLDYVSLADTMAWATPDAIKRVVGAVRDKFPALELALHLHDTRGMGIANAYAGLEMGITRFDAAVAGLGGCPFAGHAGAAGNVCTEDLVFMCDEMGIETGIDLEALIGLRAARRGYRRPSAARLGDEGRQPEGAARAGGADRIALIPAAPINDRAAKK